MRVSKDTLDLLGNLSNINGSIWFLEGNEQRIVSPSATIMADFKIAESFPQDFGIFDLNKLLGLVSLFREPDFSFEKDGLIIKEADTKNGNQEIYYRFCHKSLIKGILSKDKKLSLPSVDVQFDLSSDILSQINKSTKLLSQSYIKIEGDEKDIKIKTHNPKDLHDSKASFNVGTTDKKFEVVANIDNLKIFPGNYTVKISKNLLSQFVSNDKEITYVFPMEKDSKFE